MDYSVKSIENEKSSLSEATVNEDVNTEDTNEDAVKVSVIMPSLNVADYIMECLDSVVNQNLKEIEIICVDACSTDGTAEILTQYAESDSRITVMSSEVKSYGYQVNLGFAAAKGEYVAIVETDDYIKNDMYEILYAIAKDNDLDYIKANFAQFKGSGKARTFTHRKIVDDVFYDRVLYAGDEQSVFIGSVYPWAGIYRRKLIIDNNIRLNETPGASYQDNGLVFQVYAYGKRGYFTNKEFYYLRREEQDASYYAPHKVNEIFTEFDFIEDFLNKSGYYDTFAPRFWKLKYATFCWRANMLSDEHKLEFMQRFADDFKKAFQEGRLNTSFFNKDEKRYLFGVMACPELVCWKRYYTSESVWQKSAVNQNALVLTNSRTSIEGKRILILTNEFSASGAQLSCFAQSKVLCDMGAYVEVWSLKDGELREEYENEGIKTRVVLQHEFRRSQYQDLIQMFDIAIANTVLSLQAAYVCEKLIPTIFYIRSDGQLLVHFFKNVNAFKENYEMFYSLKNADYLVAVSDSCGDWVKENLNPNVTVINNFVEDRFEELGSRVKTVKCTDKIKFLSLGTIEPRKGYDIYIDAYRSLPDEYKRKCEIHFAGRSIDSSRDFYNQILDKAGKTPGCVFHGEILDRDELYNLILDCDVMVVPSRSESFSRVVAEGAMLSKPVIVTEDVGAKFLVKKHITGWRVETGSVKSLEEAFRSAVDNAARLNKMGENARAEYLKSCTAEIYSQKLQEYVERVLCDSKERNYKAQKNVKLYSFDVFDTLITRTTGTPTGIFSLVQDKLAESSDYSDIPQFFKKNFFDLRINAERLARFMRNGCEFEKHNPNYEDNEDITFEELYGVFTFSGLLTNKQAKRIMELEIETEIENTIAIPRNVEMVKKLKAEGARVIAISDMYHSSATIRRIMTAADPELSDIPVYVSCELRASKGTGNAYRAVYEKEKIVFEEWHHTGDHKTRDFEVPEQLGIRSTLYPISWISGIESYILGTDLGNSYTQKVSNLPKKVRIINNAFGKSALGADLGAFILIPYIEFIMENCAFRNIKRLYFVARDGYILKKIADRFIEQRGLDITTKYLYGSRNAWRVFSKNSSQNDVIAYLGVSNYNHITTVDDLAEVFSLFGRDSCIPAGKH